MNAELQEIADQLLRLPTPSRLLLGELLVESVDTFVNRDVAEAWEAEIAKRVADYEDGNVKGIPSTEVFQEARQRLRETSDLSSARAERDD